MTAGPTITPTHPSLCLYQYRRCCFVMLSQLSGFVGVFVVGTAWGLNPRVTVSRGDMGVSDWGNKGSVIKGVSMLRFHVGGIQTVVQSLALNEVSRGAIAVGGVSYLGHET